MNIQWRYKNALTAFLFLILSAGMLFAQYQGQSAPPPAYGQDQSGYGQDQGGYPTPPPTAQNSYPDQQGYPPQGYPPQQGYPSQPGQAGPQQQQQDPPGRVARVQYMSGDVSIQPGGVNDWIAASQNRPLTTSDRIWTDKNSRAELNVGDGFLRMNSETSVTLTNVSDNAVQIELDQGTVAITVRHLEQGEIYEVDTPNYAFTVTKAGEYRFDVYPSEDQSWVTVRKGNGEATGRGTAVRVNSGEQVRFTSGNSLQHTAESVPARDGFDDWVQVRDKRLDESLSARYVSPGVIGYQDLDQYGRWQPTPAYGNVWVPYSVPVGWAPYRFGHWVWIAPWGWTWVDDQPWGFAPFHYGRWVYWGGGWAWAPGPVGYWTPYYSPALVGWIGGPGFGVGFGFGSGFGIGINFGWFPLGWGEPFYPRYAGWGWGGWYRGGGYVSNTYIRNVNITNTNITNITNVTNNYYNSNAAAPHYGFRNTPGAVTAAPASAITSGAAINRVGGAVPASELGRGNLLGGASVNPTHQSVLGGNTALTHGLPPSSAFGRSVVTANKPANNLRPANLQSANAATLSHGNLNALARGGTSATNAAAPNTRLGGTVSSPGTATANGRTAGTGSGIQTHGPATAGTEAHVDTTPTSQGGHYVPRPPSAGGAASSATRPGSVGSTYSQSQGQGAAANNGHGSANGTSSENRSPVTNGNQPYGSPSNSTVPRPPSTYQPSRPATTATPSQSSAPSSSGSKESSHSGSKESSHGDSSHGPGAALSLPHSPSGYSSRPAPTYSASTGYSSRPLSGSYSNGNRSSYSASPSYNSGRSYGSTSSYRSAAPYFGNRSSRSASAYNSRSYGTSPTYSSRSYGASPAYSARSTSSYSVPRSSPSSSYHAPSGGGSHSSGGSHSGGGGGHGR